ncbi:MAG: InlB B-repeat-containing protein [Mucilaginibacter sp.]
MDSTQVRKSRGYIKMSDAMWSVGLMLVIFFTAGCKKDTYKGEIAGKCPIVVSTDPVDKAVDVVLDKVISVTFNTNMDPATINKTTLVIKQGATLISGTVAATPNGAVFTFKPDVALSPFAVYTGTVTTGATDTLHTALASDYVWTFTTIPLVTLSANPVIGGVATGSGTFAQGSSVTVTATPNAGYVFTNWTNAGVIASTSSSYQFTMAGNRTLVANFAKVVAGKFAVVLSSLPTAGGVTGGAGSFNAGSTVTTTATPATGYAFVNWTEGGVAVSVSSSYQFVLSKNRTLVANFKIIPASQFAVVLSSNPPQGGTTVGSGAYAANTSVTVTATKNAGYNFINWTENGAVVSTSAAYTFPLTANRTLVADFTPITYTLNVTAVNGTVVKNPNLAAYNSGATVQLTAKPAAGYAFISWSGDATGAVNPLTVTMNANKNITANFALIPPPTFTLAVTAVHGTVVKNPNLAAYNSGATVKLTATPAAGYAFTSWSGDATGAVNPLTVTMNANKKITANFTLIPPPAYTLNVTAVNGTVVKTPNQPTYLGGTNVQLRATPNAGYTFVSWSGDATGSVNPLTVLMNANKNVTANFAIIPPIGPGQINFGAAGTFTILTKSGISTTGITSVGGNIGVSPAAASSITGFGLIMNTGGQSSRTPIVTGSVFAADYAAPTPGNLTVAINNMQTAYTTANGLVTPAPIVNIYAGNISGRILPPGLYKWTSGVLVTGAGVTLSGGPNDTWVFQIAQDLTVNAGAKITLIGGAQAKNITWVVAGQAILGTNVNFSGNILSKTLISLNTGTKVTGRLLAQTAVTLNASTVVLP